MSCGLHSFSLLEKLMGFSLFAPQLRMKASKCASTDSSYRAPRASWTLSLANATSSWGEMAKQLIATTSKCKMGSGQQQLLSWTTTPPEDNLLEYLQKVNAAPNFSESDSAGFAKMQSVPPHRQKGSYGEELSHPNLLAHGSEVSRLLVPRFLRIKSCPGSPGLKTHS